MSRRAALMTSNGHRWATMLFVQASVSASWTPLLFELVQGRDCTLSTILWCWLSCKTFCWSL